MAGVKIKFIFDDTDGWIMVNIPNVSVELCDKLVNMEVDKNINPPEGAEGNLRVELTMARDGGGKAIKWFYLNQISESSEELMGELMNQISGSMREILGDF